ncbi:MAG TPA: DUF5658 family protein [Phycisphaerales bacterium]|nr:DUF5658 family protein [Phycisphaerales bacterium]
MLRPGISPAMGFAALRVPNPLAGRLPRRSVRVVGLVGIILALSLMDLMLTLTYVMEIGLIEDNPLARRVMQAGGPGLLIAWKLLSVGFAGWVLLRYRSRGVAELAAVFSAGVMVWLTARWVGYIETSALLTPALAEMEIHGQGHWVTLSEADAGS